MSVTVTHSTIATLPDEPGAEVNKAEWNDGHVVVGLGTAAEAATTDFDAAGAATDAVAAHAGAADPHTGYQKESEKGIANGYASLGAATLVPVAQLGSGVADATKVLDGTGAWVLPPPGPAGPPTITVVEKNLGAGLSSGTFDITGAGMTPGKPVSIQQAAGPYTDKGDLDDEAEMDQVSVTGYVFDATTIRCFWNAGQSAMAGNVKFQYLVGA